MAANQKRTTPTAEEKARLTLEAMIAAGEVSAYYHRPTGEIRYFDPDQAATLNLAEYRPLN